MELYEQVKETIRTRQMLAPGDTVTVGLSGGPDSVCLLVLLVRFSEEVPVTLRALHVHHGIRGEEADRDAAFSRTLCETLGVPFALVRRDIPAEAKEKKISLEEAGHLARAEIFAQEAETTGGKVALAHHRGDAAETALFHAVRGSGLAGLAALRPVRGHLIRPLLFISREEILAYLESEGLSYCTDSTNLEKDAVRNRIRHEVLPLLEERVNAQAGRHLAELSFKAAEAADFLETEAAVRYARYVKAPEAPYLFAGKSLLAARALAGEMPVMRAMVLRQAVLALTGSLKDVTAEHVRTLEDLLTGPAGREADLPGGVTAFSAEAGVVLTDGQHWSVPSGPVALAIPGETVFGPWRVTAQLADGPAGPEKRYTKWLDYDKIGACPAVRTRLPGDTMEIGPNGLRKKLRRLLADEGVPAPLRDTLPLVTDGSRILWAVGWRVGYGLAPDDGTRRMLRLDVQVPEEKA